MPDLDALVVGAGPAGVAAALTARSRGLEVVLVDKARFPRDKTCGDGLTAGALRLLERLGVDVPAIPGYEKVGEAVLIGPTGRQVELPLPRNGSCSVVVPRRALDDALVRHAVARGIDVREGIGLGGVSTSAEGVRARLSDGSTVHARWLIAADGHWSTVRRLRAPEAPRDLGTWHAFRQYHRRVAQRKQWVIFDRDLLPGYAWIFPLAGERANVGLGVLRTPGTNGKQLAAHWQRVMARVRELLGGEAEPEEDPRAWPIPATYSAARLTDPSAPILYVGDAAAVVDPMTGEGIAQALETGILASGAIARGGRIAERYTRSVDRELGRDLRFAASLQRVLRSPVGARLAIAAAGLTPWTRRNFARWMFEDYPRALVLTPDRWRRGIFSGATGEHEVAA